MIHILYKIIFCFHMQSNDKNKSAEFYKIF